MAAKIVENQPKTGDNQSAAVLEAPTAPLTELHFALEAKMAPADPKLPRQALSVRTRFEIFKRDDFTCRYCGRTTPAVVLGIDHVVPVAEGGSNDPMNLVTACWDCNSGKSAVPLADVITGEDPHDRAILLLEKQRQLREYDRVLADMLAVRTRTAQELLNWWCEETGNKDIPSNQFQWLVNQLQAVPQTLVQEAMLLAISRNMTKDWRYAIVVLRNWREDGRYGTSYA